MIYLDVEALVHLAHLAVGGQARPWSAGVRGGASAGRLRGQEAYPDVHEKAAALLHSVVGNHALVDGNKRLGWVAAVVFLDLNGVDLDAPEDDAYDLVIGVAEGRLDVPVIRPGSPRGRAPGAGRL